MKKIIYINSAFIFVFFLALVSCNSDNKSGTENKEEEILPENIVELREDQIKLANIDTAAFLERSLSGSLKVNGLVIVSPQSLATVCFPLGGYVKSTSLIPGTYVRKGQTLAILENQEFIKIQKDFLEAKSKLEYATSEFNRHTELYKDNVYSEKNLQQVTSEYKILKAEVKALEQQLKLIGINPSKLDVEDISSSVAIVSPIAGFVKTVNVNIGKNVTSSDVLFEIINSDKLLLELTLFEKDAHKVAIGQKIHFFINDENEQHDAVIYQTGKFVGTDKTYKVYATVSSVCKNVIPGMYTNAIIEASRNEVTAVPKEAVVSFDDKDYIFVFEKNKIEGGKNFTEYRMVEVKIGVTDGSYTEVILPDDVDPKIIKVVVKGAYNLLSAKKNAGEMSCG